MSYLGLGEQFIYRFKNGNEEPRWKLVDCVGPDEEVWFMLEANLRNTVYDRVSMAVFIDDDYIKFYWLTNGTMRISNNNACPKKLNKLEVARVESTIENALAGADND